jgi:hypothetical protein
MILTGGIDAALGKSIGLVTGIDETVAVSDAAAEGGTMAAAAGNPFCPFHVVA